MQGKKNIFMLACLMLIIALLLSYILAIGAESLIYAANDLFYAVNTSEPLDALSGYSWKTIELIPDRDAYADQATFDLFLNRLDGKLKSFEAYDGLIYSFDSPWSVSMYYKEGEDVQFCEADYEDEYSGTGWLRTIEWADHEFIANNIITTNDTLVKTGIIPELDMEKFGRSYTATEEIPVLVGGNYAKEAIVGEVYQAVLYPRTGMKTDVAPEVVNVRIIAITDTHNAIIGKVGKTTLDVGRMPEMNFPPFIIMPKIVNSEREVPSLGLDQEFPLPSKVTIAFNQSPYSQGAALNDEIVYALSDFGEPLSYSDEGRFYVPFWNFIHSQRKFIIHLLTTVFFVLTTVALFSLLLNKMFCGLLEKLWHKMIAVTAFSILCYLLISNMLGSKFTNTLFGTMKLLKLEPSMGDVRVTFDTIFISSKFMEMAVIMPIALLAVTLIVSILVSDLSFLGRKKGETAHD